MGSLEFFLLTWSFRPHYGPGVDTVSNTNEYQGYLLGGKGGRFVGRTTLAPSCADCLEILGASNSWTSHGHQACIGTALPVNILQGMRAETRPAPHVNFVCNPQSHLKHIWTGSTDFNSNCPLSNSRKSTQKASYVRCPVFEICASRRIQPEYVPSHFLPEDGNRSCFQKLRFLQNAGRRTKSSVARLTLRGRLTVSSRLGRLSFACIQTHLLTSALRLATGAPKWAPVFFERVFHSKVKRLLADFLRITFFILFKAKLICARVPQQRLIRIFQI
jgi:hypothetical protein